MRTNRAAKARRIHQTREKFQKILHQLQTKMLIAREKKVGGRTKLKKLDRNKPVGTAAE